MERRFRFGAKRAGEREGEGQWLPLAIAAGGQNLRYRRAGARASEASERSGAERSGAVAVCVFDCRSQLFGSQDVPYFDFECRFYVSRVCVWQMFYNIFEYF